MGKSNMEQDILKVLMSEEQLHARVQEMGDELYDRFHDKDPIFVGVLKGCFIFMADLVRATQMKSEIEFIGTIVTLLDKPARREKPIVADLSGFEVPDEFVVGYGLDYAQQYRNYPCIGVLKPEVYSK